MSIPRRVIVTSSDIVVLLSLRVLRDSAEWNAGPIGIGLPGTLHPARGQPGHDVRDLLVRHRPSWHVPAPVRRPEIGAAGDDERAQSLVADQREERIVRDGA